MYGLPSDFDPTTFVGRELDSITYAVNVIVLSFSDRLTVSISGAVPYCAGGTAEAAVDRPPVSGTELVKFVGQPVTGFDLKSPRELILKFAGDGWLTLLDDADTYECYLIKTGDREIVV